jgi:hypothetical protein
VSVQASSEDVRFLLWVLFLCLRSPQLLELDPRRSVSFSPIERIRGNKATSFGTDVTRGLPFARSPVTGHATHHWDEHGLAGVTQEPEEIYKISQEMIVFGAWLEDFKKSQNSPSGVLCLSSNCITLSPQLGTFP